MAFVYENDAIQTRRELRLLSVTENVSLSEMCRRSSVTKGTVANALSNNHLRLSDLNALLDSIGYDLVLDFVKREEQPS